MKWIIGFLFFVHLSIHSLSQEFACNVLVNSSRIEGTDKRVFDNLQTSLNEFVNNRIWTNYEFLPIERIECSILITLEERVAIDEFKGQLNIALRRPVFNSTYSSVLFNYVDENIQFQYIEFQSLDFVQNTYTSNLTSIIAYYLYIFLGLDFDSFSLLGGTPFYEQAQAIANTAQNTPYTGWKAFESSRNRYWLVENLLNPTYQNIRKFIYEYHRLGMDIMYSNISDGRNTILKDLNFLKETYNEHPNLFILQLLLEAKRTELIDLFSEASTIEKNTAIDILQHIDPANSSKYQEILKKE